tara:strand:+ start:756 stop:962 length:207 start_codon:yes stop_codon:yes gene_type:complete
MKKIINGKEIEMSAEEITARQADIEQNKKDDEARQIIIENNKNKKASGKQKLKDLGLDDDEIKALTGA